MRGNGYTIGFAIAVCVVCSLLLSGVSSALKDKQEVNRVLDRQKNILVALGFEGDQIKKMTTAQVQETYKNNIAEMVVDKAGEVQADMKISDLDKKVASGEQAGKQLVVYKRTDPSNRAAALAYAYPVTGKGLWSTLYGYLAVKADGSEIVGLSFYKHGETPGLGAEIEKPWFRNNFIGKQLYKDGKLEGITVVKGQAKDNVAFKTNAAHMVDGMSGATLTGNGVMKMTRVVPRRYEKFFAKVASAPAAPAPTPTAPPPPPPAPRDQPPPAPGDQAPEQPAPGSDAAPTGAAPIGAAPTAPAAPAAAAPAAAAPAASKPAAAPAADAPAPTPTDKPAAPAPATGGTP